MKYIALIFILCCNIIQAQNSDVFNDDFIRKKVELMNDNSDGMIPFSYSPEFKRILIELVKIEWLEKAIKISDYYFPLFEEKLAKYDLPNDLKYLPILESGLNPKATSSVGASGLWQFMPSTGDEMGLGSNNLINLYYCPVANTDSACRYLEGLYKSYNDWKLVLSSYNYGMGNINKKIKKAGSRDYVDIYPYLPMETRAYVPKFLVIKYLVTYQNIYYDNNKKFKYVFTDLAQIKIENPTTIKDLAARYDLNDRFIRFANPQLLTEIIPKGAIIYITKKDPS
ncbi:transglycosylase-like protein with SLT domain [Mariniflexile fucanivorans]|uniref:Transglycosylase-like protein with SLT domain n=1 Tax=Mariniflexile fucanivorans TaxID=264023 RepID=A0A4R1RAN7_9FLAO|nr:lytic transglycosylase domain-containing protein [Mariniflexile fucanivorans]TCL62472.1 transglycosylase-like protein with SLT domain [Mariniflexile fucanivorans]